MESLHTDGTTPRAFGGNLEWQNVNGLLKNVIDVLLPSLEAQGNTCGSLGRNHRRTAACHRSRWCHIKCKSCTRYTATDQSEVSIYCVNQSEASTHLPRILLDADEHVVGELEAGWVTGAATLSATDQLLGGPCIVIGQYQK